MKKFLAVASIVLCAMLCIIVVTAHSGRTDSSGGHYNHSTGEYHYHHGESAHDHYDMDGDGKKDCPYNFDSKTNNDNIVFDSSPKNVLEILFNAFGGSLVITIILSQVYVFIIDLRTHTKLIPFTFAIIFILALILQIIF